MGVNLVLTLEQGSAMAGPLWRKARSNNKQLPFSGTLPSTEITIGGIPQRKGDWSTQKGTPLPSKGQL